MKKIYELCGWLGMCLIQGATLPTTWGILQGGDPNLPELSMVLMVWGGLVLYLVRAIATRDILHMVSNGLGTLLQFTLLMLIVFGG